MNRTKVDYADYTWNPIVGCKNGCTFCYARKFALRGLGEYGKHPKHLRFEPRFLPERLDEPIHVRKPSRIFAVSMGDMWSDGVEAEWVYDVLRKAYMVSQHTFLILTKRPERMAETINAYKESWGANYWAPANNLWLGTSITTQADADERIPWLLKTPAKVRWLSIEPLHGPVDIERYLISCTDCGNKGSSAYIPYEGQLCRACGKHEEGPSVTWVVLGSETGNRKGKIIPERKWIDDLEDQCDAAGVPLFEKQNLWPIVKRDLIQQYPEVAP